MKKRLWIFILIVMATYYGYRFLVWFDVQLDIDRCLDCGGRWNYTINECEYY